MKNPENFVKLFDLNVPKIEYFDYYLLQLSKTQKYKDIIHFSKLFEESEDEILEPYEYRRFKAQEVTEMIQSTNAYNELCYDKQLVDYPTSRNIEYDDDLYYFSIDLRSANWVALKSYDPDHINELGSTYFDFLSKFNLPRVFIESKYLRQFLFSKIDTKKIIKVQRNLIQQVVRDYQDELQLEGVRNDEVIFSFKKFTEIKDIFEKIDKVKYKVKIFKTQKMEDFRIDNLFDISGNLIHKELVGLDSSLFYLNQKKYITGENITLKDLYFRSNGKLAIWYDNNLKIDLNV